MVRLCSKSSRPYSGRPATRARQQWRGRRSAMAVVREQESAEAIVPGVTSRKTAPDGLTTREGLNLAGRHDHRWSCPGAMRPNRLSCGQRSSWQRKSAASFRKDCQEPPYADPHVRWCGSREGKPSGPPVWAFLSIALSLASCLVTFPILVSTTGVCPSASAADGLAPLSRRSFAFLVVVYAQAVWKG